MTGRRGGVPALEELVERRQIGVCAFYRPMKDDRSLSTALQGEFPYRQVVGDWNLLSRSPLEE